jgi:hypothetical protein
MLPLFEMMMKAGGAQGGGATIEAFAKQFNLAQEQVSDAMAALMPPFSAGFKRKAANPYDLSDLMSTVFSGAYGRYFEDMGKAFTPQGKADGNAVLEKLFGSKEVSRAIAAQVEQFTGIGQEIIQKMMPAMAGTLMGGFFKQFTGQMGMPFANQFPAGDAFGPALETMQKQWMTAMGFEKAAPKPDAASNPADNPFAQAMRAMWGLEKPEQPQPSPTAPGAAPSYAELVNQMFDSGVEAQKGYQKNLETMFESHFGSGKTGKT